MNKTNPKKGFTLIELIITISIFGILATMAIPGLQNMHQNNIMVANYNELLSGLNYTRSSAVTQGKNAYICKLEKTANGGFHCGSNDVGDDNWSHGWIVYVDENDDNNLTSSEILRVYENSNDNLHLSYHSNKLTFNRQGFSSTGTFQFCDSRGDGARRGMVISNTGRIRKALASDNLSPCSKASGG